MANKKQQESIRQRAFRFLNDNTFPSRKEAVNQLSKEFNISTAYAATIFQHNRNEKKANGEIINVYRVIDIKDSKTCDPYISSRLSSMSDTTIVEHITPKGAVEAYLAHLKKQQKIITKALEDYAI